MPVVNVGELLRKVRQSNSEEGILLDWMKSPRSFVARLVVLANRDGRDVVDVYAVDWEAFERIAGESVVKLRDNKLLRLRIAKDTISSRVVDIAEVGEADYSDVVGKLMEADTVPNTILVLVDDAEVTVELGETYVIKSSEGLVFRAGFSMGELSKQVVSALAQDGGRYRLLLLLQGITTRISRLDDQAFAELVKKEPDRIYRYVRVLGVYVAGVSENAGGEGVEEEPGGGPAPAGGGDELSKMEAAVVSKIAEQVSKLMFEEGGGDG
jgi:hypothetical protein